MTSNQISIMALRLIGGEPAMAALKVPTIQHLEDGLGFFVPMLGGLVGCRITQNGDEWDLKLEVDVLETIPRHIRRVPSDNLKIIVHHLFGR